MTDQLVVLLHLCDSLFPSGSFAHSDGLEAATSRGDIQTAADLRAWLDAALTEVFRRVEGPAVARAWSAVAHQSLEVLPGLDDELYALRPTSAGRESTRAMGTRLLKTCQQIRPSKTLAEVVAHREHMTLPVAFGVVSAASNISLRAAVEGFGYTRLAAVVSAAMRLMPLGQRDGHTLLAEALARVPAAATGAMADDGPLGAFTPVLDVMVMSQQYVESRLFKS